MPTDSAIWRDLEARFRALPDSIRLTATLCDRQWDLTDGPRETKDREQLYVSYRSLAKDAATGRGAPEKADSLTWWLNLLRNESPHFHLILNGNCTGGWIQNLAVASADFCAALAIRKDDATPSRLGRDQYPLCYFLYDNSHEPLADPQAELDYCKANVWRGYHALIEDSETRGMAWAGRPQKLDFAITCLCYDLAVLQANYLIDRGLRGDEAMRVFRDEAAALLEEVTSSWRASCERLAVTFDDDTVEVKDLAQPFHRVRDDLRRLLHGLPVASSLEPQAPAEGGGPASNRDGFVNSILKTKGWSILDWANKAVVDYHTANNYLKGTSNPYPSTRKKLADSLGVDVGKLPK
jgi:hypothetical protein